MTASFVFYEHFKGEIFKRFPRVPICLFRTTQDTVIMLRE